jgi:hypothetical protein
MLSAAAHLPHPTRPAAALRAASPERALVLGATGSIALSIADDELVSDQPGTPAGAGAPAGVIL